MEDAKVAPTPGGQNGEVQAEVDTSDLGFLKGLVAAPCFRETALYSIGGSSVLAGLHFQRNKDPMRSAELMVKSGCGFALLYWVACRKRYYDERELTYRSIETQKNAAMARRAALARATRNGDNKGQEQSEGT